MNPQLLESMAASCIAIAMVGILYYIGFYRYRLYISGREISRFPLFSARRTLCLLVVENKMSEDDDAWRAAYGAITVMLDLKFNFNRFDLVRRTVRVRNRIATDKDFARKYELLERKLVAAADEKPEFAEVLSDIYKGLIHMRDSRSNIGHIAAAWAWMKISLLFLRGRIAWDVGREIVDSSRTISDVSVVEAYACAA